VVAVELATELMVQQVDLAVVADKSLAVELETHLQFRHHKEMVVEVIAVAEVAHLLQAQAQAAQELPHQLLEHQ
jgi:hypothetical protein